MSDDTIELITMTRLKNTTTVTESIKSDIATKFQQAQDVSALRREKLEQIIDETFRLNLWLSEALNSALEGEPPDLYDSPIVNIEMYQARYFPKVDFEKGKLDACHQAMYDFILNTCQGRQKGNPIDMTGYSDVFKPLSEKLDIFRKKLFEIYAPQVGL